MVFSFEYRNRWYYLLLLSLLAVNFLWADSLPNLKVIKALLPPELSEITSEDLEGMMIPIGSPLIREHKIFAIYPFLDDFVIKLSRSAFYVVIIWRDSVVVINEENYLREFNSMLRREKIIITTFDEAVEIAKLLMRVIFPYVTAGTMAFFSYELRKGRELFQMPDRSELKEVQDILGFLSLKDHFKKQLQKRDDIRIVKRENRFEITISFATLFRSWKTVYCWWDWKIWVTQDSVVTKLPKGLTWIRLNYVIRKRKL